MKMIKYLLFVATVAYPIAAVRHGEDHGGTDKDDQHHVVKHQQQHHHRGHHGHAKKSVWSHAHAQRQMMPDSDAGGAQRHGKSDEDKSTPAASTADTAASSSSA